MTIKERVERSKSIEHIDFSKFQSTDEHSPLVKIISDKDILVEPCWTLENDWEGKRYTDYILEHPNYDGIYLREEVAKRLKKAASRLPSNLQIVIRAGHRPIEVQRRILIECAEDYKNDNPGISDEEALAHAREFVSDPAITLPPHVCGAAVDVELININRSKLLDFGSKINDDTDQSYLHYPDLTEDQKKNRLVLLTAMLDAGFASCMPEWWHFSYGDQVWAWFYGNENSLFSPIDI